MNRSLEDWVRVSSGWPTDSKVRNIRDLKALLADAMELAADLEKVREGVPSGSPEPGTVTQR